MVEPCLYYFCNKLGFFWLFKCIFLEVIWDDYVPKYDEFNIYFYFLFFYLIGIGFWKLISLKFNFYRVGNPSVIVIDIIYFLSIFFQIYFLIIRGGYTNSNSVIPFSTLINSFIFIVPIFKVFIGKKGFLLKSQFFITIFLLLVSGTRFNAVCFCSIYFYLNNIFKLKNILLVFILIVSFAFIRESNTDYNNLAQKFSSIIGSEIRDGLAVSEYFSQNEINNIKKDYMYNMIVASIPGYSRLGLLDGNKFRENLISTQYSIKLGLDRSLGIIGIRVGIVREINMLFGMVGLFLLAMFLSLIIYLNQNVSNKSYLKLYSSFLLIIPFYALIGQPDLFLSFPINLIFTTILLQFLSWMIFLK